MLLPTQARHFTPLQGIIFISRWLVYGAVLFFISMLLWNSSVPSLQPDSSIHQRGHKWIEFPGNPVLPDEEAKLGTVFDLALTRENMTSTGVPADLYFSQKGYEPVETAMTWRMWNSWRRAKGIGYSTSVDGRKWNQSLEMSLGKNDSIWEWAVNRPFVKKIATGKYGMWYTGQDIGKGVGGWIGYVESTDGIVFDRIRADPVMVPTLPWERNTVMTPTIVDLPNGVLRMYYSGGESYEPDAIAVAHSYDSGITWVKNGNPIFLPDVTSGPVGTWWDSYKVTSPYVFIGEDGYFYMFYAGFRDVDYSSIGLVRSKDGLTNWEMNAGNPIVDIVEGKWNCNAVYKPFAGWDEVEQEWLLWYNGRCAKLERIGLSIHKGKSFGSFVKRG